nr:hypothetical protein [Tanacetum cinerariifolium]
MCEMFCQTIQKKREEKRIEEEQAANARYWKIPTCCDDDGDYNSAITPNEPIDSLSMGDEHLNTIPATELDEFIKSCVENLVLNPMMISHFLIKTSGRNLSNPLFEEEIISTKIDPHHFDAKSDLIESMLNHDSSIIYSSSKIDSLLDEFTSELTLLKSISLGIDKTDCHPENEIRLIERLLYDNSSPRPPKEFVSENSNTDIESFFPSPIPNKDSDSLDNYSLSLLVIKSYHFDIPSFFRPPVKPPDGNTGILNIKMMGDISDQKVPIPNLTITHVSNQEKSSDLFSSGL